MKKASADDVIKGAVAGLVGGLVASFVMSEFQTLLSALSEEEKKSQNDKSGDCRRAQQ